MGPQLYRCGNEAIFHYRQTRRSASMGPQLYRCGNSHDRQRKAFRDAVLQWGRNFIVAEIRRTRTRRVRKC